MVMPFHGGPPGNEQQTYIPQAGDILLEASKGVTELFSRILGGFNGCGEAALIAIMVVMGKAQGTPSEVTSFIWQVIKAGFTSNGAITGKDVIWLASQNGVKMESTDWNKALDTLAGSVPIEIEVANAAAFGGTDSTVHVHFVTVLGKTRDGLFIVSDPNSNQSKTGQLVVYSKQQFINARPFWAGIPSGFTGIGGGGVFGDIAKAIQDFPANLITQVENAFRSIPGSIDKFFNDLFGVENTTDLTYRAAFIISGLVAIGIGAVVLAMITTAQIENKGEQVVAQKAQDIAPAAQTAAIVAG